MVRSIQDLKTKEGVWAEYRTKDPLDDSIQLGALLRTKAEGASGDFEVTATCGSTHWVFLNITYFDTYKGKDVEYLHTRTLRGMELSDYRMALDKVFRRDLPLPMDYTNEVTFGFVPDSPFQPSPDDLLRASTVKIELPLSIGGNAILAFHTTDPDFGSYVADCVSGRARVQADEPPPSSTSSNDVGTSPANTPPPQVTPNTTTQEPVISAASRTPNPVRDAANTLPPDMAVLTVHSGYRGPNPVAGINVYLMHDDFVTTMRNAGYKVPANGDPRSVFSAACAMPNQRVKCDQMFAASKASAVAIKRADTTGSVIIPVQPGDYYLLVYSYGQGRPALYWDEKITLTAGPNSFILGPQNAKPLR